ncbi:putative holin-like toxin [Schleiferilactobacillus harbinensis]
MMETRVSTYEVLSLLIVFGMLIVAILAFKSQK